MTFPSNDFCPCGDPFCPGCADPQIPVGVVLDESGTLKAIDAETRTNMIKELKAAPYPLHWATTPEPNESVDWEW